MDYITREELNHFLKGRGKIEAEDLVYVLEEKLGYTVSLEKKHTITERQRKLATNRIFSEPDIVDQLKRAMKNRDPELSRYSGNEEEFSKLVDKMNGGNERLLCYMG